MPISVALEQSTQMHNATHPTKNLFSTNLVSSYTDTGPVELLTMSFGFTITTVGR
jgi:hypothetical protein